MFLNGLVVVGVSTFNDDIKGDNATNYFYITSVTATYILVLVKPSQIFLQVVILMISLPHCSSDNKGKSKMF